jgi:hypothetical protein
VAFPFRVDEHVAAPLEAEEQRAFLGTVENLESERLGVERPRPLEVVDGEA